MTDFKYQHWVPSSYLKAWADPEAPPENRGKVWRASKTGQKLKLVGTKRIFGRDDTYTIYDESGNRDVSIEKWLSEIEDQFSRLRREKLSRRLALDIADQIILCGFVAAAYGRTPVHEERTREMFKAPIELIEDLRTQFEEDDSEEATRKSHTFLSLATANFDELSSEEQLRETMNHPLQSTLGLTVPILSGELMKLQFAILETNEELGFITSDNPVQWFDPRTKVIPKPRFAGGLVSPTIEISMPISPKQTVFFAHVMPWPYSYVPLDISNVGLLNKNTRINAEQYIILQKPQVRAKWFNW